MPLDAQRRACPPGPRLPAGLKPSEDVFVLRVTGEVVRSYAEYTAKHALYSAQQWTDKYFGRSGLTYEEALRLEDEAEQQIKAQFPKAAEADVVRLIHHSTLRKDELVNRIHASLQPAADSDKENGGGSGGSAAAAGGAAPPPVTKRLLNHFLIYVADKHHPGIWVCKDPWVKRFGLATELPAGVKAAAGTPKSPEANGAAGAEAATPMKSPLKGRNAADGQQQAPPRSLEEEEARLRPGSIRAAAFMAMKACGAEQPLSADDVVRITTADGSRVEWSDANKRSLYNILHTDAAFARVARGRFTLRAFGVQPLSLQSTPQPAAADVAAKGSASKDAMAAGAADQKPPKAQGDAAEAAPEPSGLAGAEQRLAAAQRAVAARKADLDEANRALDVCQQRLAEAKAAAKASPAKPPAAAGGDEADGASAAAAAAEDADAQFALPERLREYSGPPDDRKALMAWRHEKVQEERRLAQERHKYEQQRRLSEAKAARAGTEALQQALERSKKAATEAALKHARALQAEAKEKAAVERERQRERLRDAKEKCKQDREKQKQAEKEDRERRRAEALAAKRYPIDDLELLFEELAAAAAGARGGAAAAPGGAAEGAAPQPDVAALSGARHLGGDDSLELGRLLYVADTLSQFSKQLGVRGVAHGELRARLAAATAAHDPGAARQQQAREALQWLACTYVPLLKVLVEDVVQSEGAARLFTRWLEALSLGAASWPELARRWVLLQQQYKLASPEALEVAEVLRVQDAGVLTPQQHLVLLTQLLDDCMDTQPIRDLLATRIDAAAEVAAGARSELAEQRKRLRELVDAEKENRRKKRAETLALAQAAAVRQLKEKGELVDAGEAGSKEGAANGSATAVAAAGGDQPAAEDAGGREQQAAKRMKSATKEILSRVAGASLAELKAELEEEEEPSWELPPELQQYGGPEGDKKLMSEFRRKQQEERKRLDKARAKWHAGAAARGKKRAEAKRQEQEEERRLARDRQKAEEAVAEQLERLEQQLERYLVRRQPLGSDRFCRMYWWGVGGHRDALLLQHEVGCAESTLQLLQEAAEAAAEEREKGTNAGKEQGVGEQQQQRSAGASLPLDQHKGLMVPRGAEAWSLIDDAELLDKLVGCLEQRGVREKELRAAVEKMLPALSSGIAKAATARQAAAATASAEGGGGGSKKERASKKEAEAPAPRELPSRHARSAAAEQIRKQGTAPAKAKEEAAAAAAVAAAAAAAVGGGDEEAGPFAGWAAAAVRGAVASVLNLAADAAAARAPLPPACGSWGQFRQRLEALAAGEVAPDWEEEAAAAAAALATAGADGPAAAAAAGGAAPLALEHDAAWARAVQAAAAAAAAASADVPERDAAAASAAAALSQLRLQLLNFESQLIAATGEAPVLAKLAGGEDGEDGEEEEEQGEEEEGEEEQQEEEGAGGAGSSEGEAGGAASMDVDGGEPQQEQRPASGGRGKRGRAATQARAAPAEDAEEVGGPERKRRRQSASDPGLPPRPEASAGRGGRGRRGAAAAAAAAVAAATSSGAGDAAAPESREGSVAPAPSRGKTRGAGAGSSRAASQEPEAAAGGLPEREEEVPLKQQQQQQRRGRKGARPSGKAAAAPSPPPSGLSEEAGGDDGGAASDEDAQRRRHSLPHHKRAEEQLDDPDEEVAELADDAVPFRLRDKTLWRSAGERGAWRAGAAASATPAAVAYAAAALAFHAAAPLQRLARAAAGSGGKRKAGGKT